MPMLRQRCDGATDTVAIENNGSLQIRVPTHSGTTPLFSMSTVSLASSQHCRSVDTDAQCKWALKACSHRPIPIQKKRQDIDDVKGLFTRYRRFTVKC